MCADPEEALASGRPRRTAASRSRLAVVDAGMDPVLAAALDAGWELLSDDGPPSKAQMRCPDCQAVLPLSSVAKHTGSGACKKVAAQLAKLVRAAFAVGRAPRLASHWWLG